MSATYFATLAALVLAGFFLSRGKASSLAGSGKGLLHSLPIYHGLFTVVLVLVPMLVVFAIGAPLLGRLVESAARAAFPGKVAEDVLLRGATLRDVHNLIAGQYSGTASAELKVAGEAARSTLVTGQWTLYGIGVGLGLLGLVTGFMSVGREFRARNRFERFLLLALAACAAVAILTTVGIVFSVLYETVRFFFDPALKGRPTIPDFLFGTEWNPQAALRADQGDIKTAFGFIPLLTGTLLITLIAIIVAGPLGLFSAI